MVTENIMAASTRLDPFNEDKVSCFHCHDHIILFSVCCLKAELDVLTRKPVCFVIFGKPVSFTLATSRTCRVVQISRVPGKQPWPSD